MLVLYRWILTFSLDAQPVVAVEWVHRCDGGVCNMLISGFFCLLIVLQERHKYYLYVCIFGCAFWSSCALPFLAFQFCWLTASQSHSYSAMYTHIFSCYYTHFYMDSPHAVKIKCLLRLFKLFYDQKIVETQLHCLKALQILDSGNSNGNSWY